jgi:hypothetical protein
MRESERMYSKCRVQEMKSDVHTHAVSSPANAYLMFTEEAGDHFYIIADALGQLCRIQAETFATLFAMEMVGSVPLFSPGNNGYLIEKIPEFYRNQWEQVLKAMFESTAIVSGAQLKLMQSHADHISNGISNGLHKGKG